VLWGRACSQGRLESHVGPLPVIQRKETLRMLSLPTFKVIREICEAIPVD